MCQDIKTRALLETAKAYMSRGAWIQYDQRCMDRITQLSPRRSKLLPPEAATEQRTIYLDCSSFVGAVYYETFGFELESDLTWHMIDVVKPRVFFRELTHEETAEEKEAIKTEVSKLLIPGDVIVYDRYVGSGHTVLYIGEGRFYHCTTNGRPNSYDYENNKNREYPDGGLFEDTIEKLFTDERIFKETVRRIAVLRPLERMGEPTEKALKRLDEAYGLVCSVTSSHYGGKSIAPDDMAVYTITIKNTTDCDKKITVTFNSLSERTVINANSTEKIILSELPDETDGVYIKKSVITVGGMELYVHPIITGKKLSPKALSYVTGEVEGGIKKGLSAYDSASMAYNNLEINAPKTERELLYSLFYLHDNPGGDVLSRKPQNPASDMAVYSYFGGRGVTTPEVLYNPHIRTNRISPKDLMPGDIILTADDALFMTTHSYYYTGEYFLSTDEVASPEELTDSLFGKFCFVLIRPSNTRV